jgi:hypothetical protein
LFAEHHFVSNIDDLARDVAPGTPEPGIGIAVLLDMTGHEGVNCRPVVGIEEFQSDLAFALAGLGKLRQKCGRPAEAAGDLRQALAILERTSRSAPADDYNLASLHALLGVVAAEPGSGMSPAQGRAEAEQAMQSLQRAVVAGFRSLGTLRTDTDLDSLRSRPDFQLLIMDLAMPENPFAF